MNTKKFWCHYIGNDGNTPKRRNIELTDIHELLPQVSNEGAKTPVWFETEEQDYGRKYYHLYAQLSDKVAVLIVGMGIGSQDVERVNLTDEEITDRHKKWLENYLANYFNAKYDTEESLKRRMADGIESDKRLRGNVLRQIVNFQDYDNYLLTGDHWISNACLRAFTEAESPVYPVLQALREQKMAEREADRKRREEEHKQHLEEEARKKAEEEAKERERLTQEAEKFRQGKAIAGSDVVDLCRRYGIDIHLRTVHNLQQVIATINGKEGTCQYYRTRGKRRPQLDGCYETAGKLYHHLQEHYDELVGYMKECNKSA